MNSVCVGKNNQSNQTYGIFGKFNLDHIFFLSLKTPQHFHTFWVPQLTEGQRSPAVTRCANSPQKDQTFPNSVSECFLTNALKVPNNKWQVKQSKAVSSPISPFGGLQVGGTRKTCHISVGTRDCCWSPRAPTSLRPEAALRLRSLGWVIGNSHSAS